MLDRIERYSERFLDGLLALILGCIVLLTLSQVVSRYIIGQSFAWSEELNLMLWAWLIAIGSIKAVHLRITMLSDTVGPTWQIVLEILQWAVSMSILYVLFVHGLGMAKMTANDRHMALSIMTRKWLFVSLVVCAVPWAIVSTVRTGRQVSGLMAARRPLMEG